MTPFRSQETTFPVIDFPGARSRYDLAFPNRTAAHRGGVGATRTALGDARVPSAANKLDNLDSMDGIQNRRTKVAPTSNAACADAIFWRQIFWQQRGRLSAQ